MGTSSSKIEPKVKQQSQNQPAAKPANAADSVQPQETSN